MHPWCCGISDTGTKNTRTPRTSYTRRLPAPRANNVGRAFVFIFSPSRRFVISTHQRHTSYVCRTQGPFLNYLVEFLEVYSYTNIIRWYGIKTYPYLHVYYIRSIYIYPGRKSSHHKKSTVGATRSFTLYTGIMNFTIPVIQDYSRVYVYIYKYLYKYISQVYMFHEHL